MTYSWGRKLVASVLSGFIVALLVHAANAVGMGLGYTSQGSGWPTVVSISDFFTLASVFSFVLLFAAGLIDVFATWWTALIAGLVVGLIATTLDTMIYVATNGGKPDIAVLWNALGGQNLLYVALITVLTPTVGRSLYHAIAASNARADRTRRVALVRVPASNLADGIVTHVERTSVDTAKADEQWDAYVAALSQAGWQTVEVPPAETLADSVFVEDTAVIIGGTAIITNPGAESRRGEITGTENALRDLGLPVERISEPGTLDGGDVLHVGDTVYVGRTPRTNAEGIRQLRVIADRLGHTVVAVPVTRALHLKTAATALPDGTVIGHESTVDDPSVFDRYIAAPEPEGVHIVVLGPDAVLMHASAPKSAELVADLGYRVTTVDLGEFEKLEGSATCLSILVP